MIEFLSYWTEDGNTVLTPLSYILQFKFPFLVDCHTPWSLHSTDDGLDWSAKFLDWHLHNDWELANS
jgi:hypothetical protein